jgi:4-azaleucine resistance transporter AzlC
MFLPPRRPGAGDDDVSEQREGGRFATVSVRAGAIRSIPVAISGLFEGLVFGVLAATKGLSLGETLLMSGTVSAGTAQLVALNMWADSVPIAAITFATLLVNARLVLMGMALAMRDSFTPLSPAKVYGSLFFLSDESWALTMRESRSGTSNAAFLLGSGLVLYGTWISAVAVGRITGGFVHDPGRFGLDFAFIAVLVALVVDFWRGPRDIAPWTAAAAAAVAGSVFLPANLHILLGALVGISVAAVRE